MSHVRNFLVCCFSAEVSSSPCLCTPVKMESRWCDPLGTLSTAILKTSIFIKTFTFHAIYKSWHPPHRSAFSIESKEFCPRGPDQKSGYWMRHLTCLVLSCHSCISPPHHHGCLFSNCKNVSFELVHYSLAFIWGRNKWKPFEIICLPSITHTHMDTQNERERESL